MSCSTNSLTITILRDNIMLEIGTADRRLVRYKVKQKWLLHLDMGGYFCGLSLSLPNVYPILKQVKPKLTTAMKSIILIGLALLFHWIPLWVSM